MTSNRKRIFAIIIAIVIVILAGSALYMQSEYNYINVNNREVEPVPTARPAIEILSKPSSPRVRVGGAETISVELPDASKVPTAFDLTFTFDSDVVEVVNIVPGRIWNSSNVLKKVIDNELGTVRLAAGQGFNAKITENLDIVEIEYRVLEPGNIVFQLTGASQFAYVGENEATPVTTKQIVIKAEN
jgi:hypothetical protein